MWIFTCDGFYSVVHNHDRPGYVMVRSRDKNHLLRLNSRIVTPGLYLIQTTPDNDYPYRLHMPVEAWAAIMTNLAGEIDYGNFKGETERRESPKDRVYSHSLHKIWAILATAFKDRRPPPKAVGP